MSVFDKLPRRSDGTQILPWDDDWENNVRQGVYDARWGRVGMEVGRKVVDIPPAIETGEIVDPGMVLQFVKGGYRELFKRIYGEAGPGPDSDGPDPSDEPGSAS